MEKRLDEVNPTHLFKNIKLYLDEFGLDQTSEIKKRGTGIVRVLMKEIVNKFSEQDIWNAYMSL